MGLTTEKNNHNDSSSKYYSGQIAAVFILSLSCCDDGTALFFFSSFDSFPCAFRVQGLGKYTNKETSSALAKKEIIIPLECFEELT
jgi:hypothetical protein